MKANKILARLAPQSWDDESQTVDAILSTGAGVKRRDTAGVYTEFLDIDASTVADLPPLLDSHRSQSLADLLGRVFDVRKENGKLIAKLHIDRPEIAARVRSGVIRDVSVGYTTTGVTERTDPKTRVRSKTARVHVIEASLVTIPADNGAQVRSNPMKKKQGADPALENDETPEGAVNDNATVETRAAILDIATRSGLDAAWVMSQADSTVEEAQAAALEAMQARTANPPRVRIINPGPSPEETLERRAEGFAAHYFGAKPSDAARQYAGYSYADHAREMLEAQGVRTRGMSTETLMTRAFHTVSDFPIIMDVSIGTTVKAAYEAAASPLVGLSRKATANDFRTQSILQIGELPKLQKVSESGEIKSVTRGEAKESWAVDTYGSIFSASRKLIINDTFNLLGDFARDAGQAAAATVADLLVAKLTESNGAGPVMGDTVRLFHADHFSVGSVSFASLSPAAEIAMLNAIGDARSRMLLQTGVDGETIIRVKPDTIVVPPRLLTIAERAVAVTAPATAGDVNVFAGKLTVLYEPRLEAIDDLAFYVVDSSLPALILGGLAGFEGPQIASRDGFEVLGREFRVTLDVGVGPNDWRGWQRIDGAEDSNSAF